MSHQDNKTDGPATGWPRPIMETALIVIVICAVMAGALALAAWRIGDDKALWALAVLLAPSLIIGGMWNLVIRYGRPRRRPPDEQGASAPSAG